MIHRLVDIFKTGKLVHKLFSAIGIIAYYIIWVRVWFSLTMFILQKVADYIDAAFPMIVLGTILIPLMVFGPFYVYQLQDIGPSYTKRNDILSSNGQEVFTEEFGKLPHFDKMLGRSHIVKVLKNEKFHNYTTRNGTKLKHIKISDSDKWICILGGYLPVDLICGYNKSHNALYTMDGIAIILPEKARKDTISSEIETFFEERGSYYTQVPPRAGTEFNTAIRRDRSELSKADWGRARYLWEKAMVSREDSYWKNNSKAHKYRPVSKEKGIDTTIFERVLSDKEIERTATAVRNKKVDLSFYLDFKVYKNEYCVCNAVELLDNLHYLNSSEGIDFLFDCLCDVDEAYFTMAIELLKKYPRKSLEEKLEIYSKNAYDSGDAQKLAGMMYLAKEIEYEIPFIKLLKGEETDPAGFEINEAALYGSEQAQQFVMTKPGA
ncbi:hypothetical protein SAMN04487770_101129 [Butyrivibrio sp. ob235]|uniref:hypothetical protein n=1 Tax=Butyrivibrio sp. ob235 TaxID=1761780 RepID=UPI0008B49AA2|nr:hypothetical protein [Butyrivibrio sp. ob235]SEK29530.1 hypothetical protein SAMN04487770_101129 [Butyrivibrio sp. ob235]